MAAQVRGKYRIWIEVELAVVEALEPGPGLGTAATIRAKAKRIPRVPS
jgi:hypothetical protein